MCAVIGQAACSYLVIDQSKMNFYFATVNIRKAVTIVDEDTEFFGTKLLSSVTEHKQHRVDYIGLATSIGPHDGREALQFHKVLVM